jgi:hypothetical protein
MVMVCAVRKGIAFEWGDLSFTMPFAKLMELIDLIEVMDASGKEEPDDFKTDLWVGKKMFRYEDYRIPVDTMAKSGPFSLMQFRGQLMAALQQYNNNQANEESQKQADEVMDEIVKNLKL